MVDDGDGLVVAAVLRDLSRLPVVVRDTTEAATAVALARELDRGRLMSTAPVAKELRATVELLRQMAALQEEAGDAVDDLAAKRAVRRANTAG